MFVDFTSPVLLKSNIILTCDWGNLALKKTVYWERIVNGMEQPLWLYEDGSPPNNLPLSNSIQIEHVGTDFPSTEHKIMIKEVSNDDEGEYQCSVNVTSIQSYSDKKKLLIAGKYFPFCNSQNVSTSFCDKSLVAKC